MMRFVEMIYTDPLLKFLVGTMMKSFIIFAVAGVFVFCLRRRSAAVRGFVWSMAVVGCLIIPLFSLVFPKWELGILPAEASVSIAQSQLSPKPVSSTSITPTPSQPNFVTDQNGTLTTLHWSDWIAIIWTGAGLFLLIRFWAVWCGPCIAEMPNLKRVYATYKDQGFDIIGVSLDDEESALRDYIKENDIQWRQIYSGERWMDDPLAQQYEITGVPEPWLIDRDGTLISHKARGEDLERLVVEALKDKSENQ